MRLSWTRIQPWVSTLGRLLYRVGDWFLRQLREGFVGNLALWSGILIAIATVWSAIWIVGIAYPPAAEAFKDRLRETRDRVLGPEGMKQWNEVTEGPRTLYHEFALYHGWRKPEGPALETINARSDDSERDADSRNHEGQD